MAGRGRGGHPAERPPTAPVRGRQAAGRSGHAGGRARTRGVVTRLRSWRGGPCPPNDYLRRIPGPRLMRWRTLPIELFLLAFLAVFLVYPLLYIFPGSA